MTVVRIGIDVGHAWRRSAASAQAFLCARGVPCIVVENATSADVDVAFVAGASLASCVERGGEDAELIVAPIALGARYKNRPIVFHDVVTQRETAAPVANDCAPVGLACDVRDPMLAVLRPQLERVLGSHAPDLHSLAEDESLEAVARGGCEFALVDSLALEHWRRREPSLGASVRTLQSLGPQPGPAWIARRTLPLSMRRRMRSLLLHMHLDPLGHGALADLALSRFVGVHPLVSGPPRLQSGFRESVRGSAGSGTV